MKRLDPYVLCLLVFLSCASATTEQDVGTERGVFNAGAGPQTPVSQETGVHAEQMAEQEGEVESVAEEDLELDPGSVSENSTIKTAAEPRAQADNLDPAPAVATSVPPNK